MNGCLHTRPVVTRYCDFQSRHVPVELLPPKLSVAMRDRVVVGNWPAKDVRFR